MEFLKSYIYYLWTSLHMCRTISDGTKKWVSHTKDYEKKMPVLTQDKCSDAGDVVEYFRVHWLDPFIQFGTPDGRRSVQYTEYGEYGRRKSCNMECI